LLVGYFKHSRGRLSKKSTIALWIGTSLFNSLFFLPSIIYVIKELNEKTFSGGINNLGEIAQTPYSWMILWWAVAIAGSIVALKDIRTNQKYR
jgi:hypothetical protein